MERLILRVRYAVSKGYTMTAFSLTTSTRRNVKDSQTNSDSELDSLRPNLRPTQHPATGEYRRIDNTPDHETPAYSTSPQVTATDPPNSNTVQSRFESELGHASESPGRCRLPGEIWWSDSEVMRVICALLVAARTLRSRRSLRSLQATL